MRPFLWIPAVLAGGYASIMGLVYWFQEHLIFHPTSLPKAHAYDFERPFEEHFIKAHDGARLNALLFPVEEAKGTIIYFHGNAGNLAEWGTLAPYFTDRNYNFLVWDYRTFGKSAGPLNYDNLLKDAESIYEWARDQYPDLPLIPFGTSIGSGPATHVAKKYQPKKVILETPFDSMESLAGQHFPWLPQRWILRYPFTPLEWLKDTKSGIYMIHGSADEIIPYQCAQNIKEVLTTRVNLTTIPGGRHNDLENHAAYHDWLDHVLGEKHQ